MNAISLALLVAAFQLSGPATVGTTLLGPPTVEASADVGFGRVDGRSALSVQPRLSYERKQGRLVLSVPIWLGMDGALSPLANWNDPESWVAIIENLTYQSRAGDIELTFGTLRHLTLGRGALVDGYGGRLDPLMPRTGAMFKLRPFDVDTQLFVSSLVKTEVVGGALEVAPLAYVGWDPAKRFRLSYVASADLSTPSAGPRTIFGGMSLGAGMVVYRSQSLGFELFTDGVIVGGDRRGVHMGLVTEWSRDAYQSASLALKTEYVLAQAGYTPGYFDVAYETERLGTSWVDSRGKMMARPEAGRYARASLELGVGALRLGMRGDVELDSRMGRLSSFGRFANRHWTMTAMVIERRLTNTKDLISLDDSKALVMEGAARIWGDFFASARVFRGWQEGASGVETATAWSLGLGYGMRGVFR